MTYKKHCFEFKVHPCCLLGYIRPISLGHIHVNLLLGFLSKIYHTNHSWISYYILDIICPNFQCDLNWHFSFSPSTQWRTYLLSFSLVNHLGILPQLNFHDLCHIPPITTRIIFLSSCRFRHLALIPIVGVYSAHVQLFVGRSVWYCLFWA